MDFLRISDSHVINLDELTRLEVYESGEVKYATLHFSSGESYRCTEDETEVLMPHLEKILRH